MAAQPSAGRVELKSREVAGVSCVVCTPPQSRGRLAHFHCGGYRMGSSAAWTPFGTRMAAASGCQVLLPDYALAPENPFPAALHDALSVVAALADSPGDLFISGDSAGGGLALSAALLAAEAGFRFSGLILMSPWLDLTATAPSYDACAATDALFSRDSALKAAEAYLQGVRPDDPLASPIFADLAQAPPTLILASAAEVLVQDSLALATRLAAAGRAAQLHIVPDQPHVWPVLQPESSTSHQALQAVAQFVQSCADQV